MMIMVMMNTLCDPSTTVAESVDNGVSMQSVCDDYSL